MFRSKWVLGSLLTLGLVLAIAIPVYAHGVSVTACKDMCKKMEEGKSSLGKAVEAAEAATKGHALTATARIHEGKLAYAVYCLVGDKLQMVPVDASGQAGEPKDIKELPGLEDEHDKDKGKDKEKEKEKAEEKKSDKKGGKG